MQNLSSLISSLASEIKTANGSLFYLLNGIKKEYGYIPEESAELIAETLNISGAEVFGFISFFKDFRNDKNGSEYRKIVVCRSESCEASGSPELINHIRETLKLEFGKFSPDGNYFLDSVHCFGSCASSPALMIDGILYENVTKEKLDRIIFNEPEKNEPIQPIPLKKTGIVFRRGYPLNTEGGISIEEYIANHGFFALKRAASLAGDARGDDGNGSGSGSKILLEELKRSGLRGKGGAGFPAWIKWQTVFNENSRQKYVICNADEGDSGAFADRAILEYDPMAVIEGMTIAGIIAGARNGIIYIRSEYAGTAGILSRALKICRESRYLGNDILGTGLEFDIEIITGGGSYVCGEETALLESIENKRGTVRTRPPVPAISGLNGCPTIINNVLTFAYAAYIFSPPGTFGPPGIPSCEHFASIGTEYSRGTMPFQISGAVKEPGIYEMPLGTKLGVLLDMAGIDRKNGKSVQIGGPLGAYFPLTDFFYEIELSYEGLQNAGGILGHGGIVVFDKSTDFKNRLANFFDFCTDESCGKCAPCRLGTTRAKEIFERIVKQQNMEENLIIINEILDCMKNLSLCGFGSSIPMPLLTVLKYFKNEITG